MRNVLTISFIMLLILSAVPITGAYLSKTEPQPHEVHSNNENETILTDTNSKESDYVCYQAANMCHEDFCDEAIKAAICIAKNNLRFFTENNKEKDTVNTDNVSLSIVKKVKKLSKELKTEIKYNEKCVFIPTSSLSNGATKTDSRFPYITAVASPWDCQSEEYIYSKEYNSGISMQGINYLCENDCSYIEALKWYLPEFDIK